MHLHNVIWYGILLFSVLSLYRQIMPGNWLPWLALFLYGVDFSHYVPIDWVANRNALISVSFCCWTLMLHHRWSQHDSVNSAAAAFLCYFLGLFSGENGVAILVFLSAYFFCLDSRSLYQCCVRYAPYIAITLVWLMCYKMGDYGSANSGIYLDPFTRPLEYISQASLHLPLLLFMQWIGYSTLIGPVGPLDVGIELLIPGLAALIVILWLLMPLLKVDKAARFFLLGSVVTLLPVCAGAFSERLLLFSGIGSFALMSQLLHAWSSKLTSLLPRGNLAILAAPLCAFIWLIHGIIHPLLYLGAALNVYAQKDNTMAKQARQMDYGSGLVPKTAIIINAPNALHYSRIYFERLRLDLETPRQNILLSTIRTAELSVQVAGNRSLRLIAESGIIEQNHEEAASYIFRDLDTKPFNIGQQLHAATMNVTVESLTDDGIPKSVLFEFAQDFDVNSVVFLEWKEGKFASVQWGELVNRNQGLVIL
jgi:hypothetical protein